MSRPQTPLAPTVADLGSNLRQVLDAMRELGLASVQLCASGPNGLRPREFDASAVRDLVATLSRLELQAAGIDLWIPPDHYSSPAHVDRAISAVCDACRLMGMLGGGFVVIDCPSPHPENATMRACLDAASRHGAVLATRCRQPEDPPEGCVPCVDPADWIAAGRDPVTGASDGASAVRLSETVGGIRVPGGTGGTFDLQAYRIACEIAAPQRPVATDLRGLTDPWAALKSIIAVWG